MKTLIILLALCGVASAGTTVDLDFKEASLHDVMRLLADVGRVNIVMVDVPETKVDVKYKRVGWDKVMAELVKRTKLASVREGNTILIGDPAVISKRKKTKVTGQQIDIDINDASAADAAELVALASGKPVSVNNPTKPAKLRLRRVPVDQAIEILALVSGGTVGKMYGEASFPACAAETKEAASLRLAGIVTVGTKRMALLLDGTTPYFVKKDDCVGKAKATVSDIGTGYVTFKTGSDEQSTQIYPRTP